MTEHTKTDGLPDMNVQTPAVAPDRAALRNAKVSEVKIACNACPVLCQISEGRSGACDRYANQAGILVRVDPVVFLQKGLTQAASEPVNFVSAASSLKAGYASAQRSPLLDQNVFVTGVGASTTYPDYKPAPFIDCFAQ